MDVTAVILKERGYSISTHVNQKLIDRCVSEVIIGYINPTLPEYTDAEINADADCQSAVYCLAYILMLRRNVVKTRFGAKEKTDRNSDNMPEDEINGLTITADMYLNILATKEGAATCPEFQDVAQVYNFNSLI